MKLKQILETEEIKPKFLTKFTASGADKYFRKYDYSKIYFSEDQPVFYGQTFPLHSIRGIPKDDENSKFYTYFTFAREK